MKGEFRIESHDTSGKLMNSQMGKIINHMGKGHFQGRKPDCNGIVEMVRLE